MFSSKVRASVTLLDTLQRPPVPDDMLDFEGVDVFCAYDGDESTRVRIGTLQETHGPGYGTATLCCSGDGTKIPVTLRFSAVAVNIKVPPKRRFVVPSKASRMHAVKDGGVMPRKQRTMHGFVLKT
jgi:hypothetical protein